MTSDVNRDSYPVTALHDGPVRIHDGCKLWCWDSGGDGEVVILLHAFSGNHLSWSKQIPYLTGLGYRVVAYSRQGFFGSSPLDLERCQSQSEDLLALMDARGITRAHLVGVAAGGATALDALFVAPGRIVSVVTASSLMGLSDPWMRERLSFLREPWFRALPHHVKELSQSFRIYHSEEMTEWQRIQTLNPKMPVPKDTRMINQPLSADITLKDLAESGVPLCLITGASDMYMPPKLLREIARHLPTARFEILQDCAHAPHIEAPEEFNRVVHGFIASD